MGNPDRIQKDLEDFEKYYSSHPHDAYREYLSFSRFWQDLFIVSDYIIMTGNFEAVNLEFLYRFHNNIKKHPILWKIFRRVFGV